MAKFKDSFLGEEKPFNMAALLLERLNDLLKLANESSINGDIARWYRVLRSIKSSVIFKLDDKETNNLLNLFSICRGKIIVYEQNKQPAFYFEIEEHLIKFEEELIKLMDKYALYYPHYAKRDPFDLLEEEYS